MTDFILHHYPPSPVSEKVRAAFGLKGLAWRSCEENRLPDRPELFAMTGGYRRIPVLQIGADIYCDTQVILAEIDARAPEPSLFPDGFRGLPIAFSRWTDGELFHATLRVAFAPQAANLPPALVADRSRLYMGPGGDLAEELKDLPHTLSQARAGFGWLDDRLAGGAAFLLGDKPSYADVQAWWQYWFVRARYEPAEAFFAEFTHLNAWAGRMEALGHGESTDITPAIANASDPTTPQATDPRDPQGLAPGRRVQVGPLTDSGETAVEGVVHAVSRERIALAFENDLCGSVVTHFPRVGYRVTPMS